jgi:hypothetical protein
MAPARRETTTVRLHPLAPDLWPALSPGLRLTMREGSRVVGVAGVIEVVTPKEWTAGSRRLLGTRRCAARKCGRVWRIADSSLSSSTSKYGSLVSPAVRVGDAWAAGQSNSHVLRCDGARQELRGLANPRIFGGLS